MPKIEKKRGDDVSMYLFDEQPIIANKALARALGFPVSRDIWDEFCLDQEINDRGIAIDPVFVESAIKLDSDVKASLMQQLSEITGLENPNSVLQMRGWLSEHGLEMESLGKKEVAKEIKIASKELVEVLTLR